MRNTAWILAVAVGLTAAPASAQLHIMVRDDQNAVLYRVNNPNGMAELREQSARIKGDWRVLVSNECTPGAGALWVASNGPERKYFLVTGRKTTSEANVAAAEQARAYAKARKGWYAGAMRTWVNYNGQKQDVMREPSLIRDAMDRTQDLIKCKPGSKKDSRVTCMCVRG